MDLFSKVKKMDTIPSKQTSKRKIGILCNKNKRLKNKNKKLKRIINSNILSNEKQNNNLGCKEKTNFYIIFLINIKQNIRIFIN
jgi:hypothetical protein